MKLQILSDLHREVWRQSGLPLDDMPWRPSPQADVIVLAGDIDDGEQAAQWLAVEADRLDTPIIYVPGNHEYYGSVIEDRQSVMRERLRDTGVHLLDCDEVVIDGVRFLGATAWTDYQQSRSVGVPGLDLAMFLCSRRVSDHQKIRTRRRLDEAGQPMIWMPSDAAERHAADRAWLGERLAERHDGPTVVVTHHGPAATPGQKHYSGDLSGAYWSDLSGLFEAVDLWAHGHTHAPVDEFIDGAGMRGMRRVCNPGGYPGDPVLGFRPGILVEV